MDIGPFFLNFDYDRNLGLAKRPLDVGDNVLEDVLDGRA